MLLDDFFSILSAGKKDDVVTCRLKLNPDHRIYEGHFPGNPVVPGVCQIGMIRETTEYLTGRHLMIRKADQIKFLRMINPHEHHQPELEITFRESREGEEEISAVLRQGDIVFLKFRGTLCTR